MLQDTISFFKEILGDKDDVLLETAFYMEGNINSILKMS
jgi:F0F1-type ATP synthase beta subunit